MSGVVIYMEERISGLVMYERCICLQQDTLIESVAPDFDYIVQKSSEGSVNDH
jgi:hypothetical protein